MPWQNEVKVLRLVNGVKDGQNGAARVSDCDMVRSASHVQTTRRTNVLDILAEHHLVEDLAARHAHKRVVHLRGAVGPQWLHIAVVLAIEGRRRPCAGLRLCGRCRRRGALRPPYILFDDLGRGDLRRSFERRDGASGGGRRQCAALEILHGARAYLLHAGEGEKVPQDNCYRGGAWTEAELARSICQDFDESRAAASASPCHIVWGSTSDNRTAVHTSPLASLR